MQELLLNYTKLNNSYKKKLVFHFGADAGLFSEYNNMLLAILYCLTHKIQFELYSKDGFFCNNNGWNEFFVPFCNQTDSSFHKKYNYRGYTKKKINYLDKLIIKGYKYIHNISYLTQDLWDVTRDRKLEQEHYSIPELGIDGNINGACRILIQLTWNYNAITLQEINQYKQSITLDKPYIGFHIRKGDKQKEAEVISENAYLEQAKKLNISNAFILTDDYCVIENIKEEYKEMSISTLCQTSERGYDQQNTMLQSPKEIRSAHIRLMASIDIISDANYFIGTFSSNPGMFIGMRKNLQLCMDPTGMKWQFW